MMFESQESSPIAQCIKNLPTVQETQEIQVQLLGQDNPLEEMTTHSSIFAWRISGTGEPGGLLSMGSHRIRHD